MLARSQPEPEHHSLLKDSNLTIEATSTEHVASVVRRGSDTEANACHCTKTQNPDLTIEATK